MSKETSIRREALAVMMQMIDLLLPDDRETFHYWRSNRNVKVSEVSAQVESRKAYLAEVLTQFAHQYGAYDVATFWGPMTGITVEGLIFDHVMKPNTKFDEPVALGDYGKDGREYFQVQPRKNSKRGKLIVEKLKELQDQIGGPSELADFLLDKFGLYQAAGSALIDGKKRVILPPRMYPLSMGLFLRTPQDRLYELDPSIWTRVPTSVFVFAQDLESTFRQKEAADAIAKQNV
jgi:hypothetical protein